MAARGFQPLDGGSATVSVQVGGNTWTQLMAVSDFTYTPGAADVTVTRAFDGASSKRSSPGTGTVTMTVAAFNPVLSAMKDIMDLFSSGGQRLFRFETVGRKITGGDTTIATDTISISTAGIVTQGAGATLNFVTDASVVRGMSLHTASGYFPIDVIKETAPTQVKVFPVPAATVTNDNTWELGIESYRAQFLAEVTEAGGFSSSEGTPPVGSTVGLSLTQVNPTWTRHGW